MRKYLLLLNLFFVFSCKTKPEIFLGFKLLSSREDYNKHYMAMVSSKKIDPAYSFYNLDCGYSDHALLRKGYFFEIGERFQQKQLTDLILYGLSNEKDSLGIVEHNHCLLSTYESKYGRPDKIVNEEKTEFQYKTKSNAFGYSEKPATTYVWDKKDYVIRIKISKTYFDKFQESFINTVNVIYSVNPALIEDSESKQSDKRQREKHQDI